GPGSTRRRSSARGSCGSTAPSTSKSGSSAPGPLLQKGAGLFSFSSRQLAYNRRVVWVRGSGFGVRGSRSGFWVQVQVQVLVLVLVRTRTREPEPRTRTENQNREPELRTKNENQEP